MGRIYNGIVVRTSYNTGPYGVIDFEEGCVCPSFMDAITLHDKAPESKPHYHLLCRKSGEKKGFYYLGGYDENLNSVWDSDRLIVCHEETTLLALSCTDGLNF